MHSIANSLTVSAGQVSAVMLTTILLSLHFILQPILLFFTTSRTSALTVTNTVTLHLMLCAFYFLHGLIEMVVFEITTSSLFIPEREHAGIRKNCMGTKMEPKL